MPLDASLANIACEIDETISNCRQSRDSRFRRRLIKELSGKRLRESAASISKSCMCSQLGHGLSVRQEASRHEGSSIRLGEIVKVMDGDLKRLKSKIGKLLKQKLSAKTILFRELDLPTVKTGHLYTVSLGDLERL